MENNKNGFAMLPVVLTVFVAVLVGVGVYVYVNNNAKSNPVPIVNQKPIQQEAVGQSNPQAEDVNEKPILSGITDEPKPQEIQIVAKPGGGCSFKEFSGKCTITDVAAAGADSDGYLGSANVNYSFVPTGVADVSGTFLSSPDKINPYEGNTAASYLDLYCLKGDSNAATYNQVLRCGVTVGAVFDCFLSVSTGGSCTPISIRFTDNGGCAKEGEYQGDSGNLNRKCCAGLAAYASVNSTNTNIANAALLCYDPAKGVPICKNPGTEKAGFYYPENTVVRYGRCVDRSACNDSLDAVACRAAGGNYFSDHKCYCEY